MEVEIKNKVICDLRKLSFKANHIVYRNDINCYVKNTSTLTKSSYAVIDNVNIETHNKCVISLLEYISSELDGNLSFEITETKGKNNKTTYYGRGVGMRSKARISESLAKDIFSKYTRKIMYNSPNTVEYKVTISKNT